MIIIIITKLFNVLI